MKIAIVGPEESKWSKVQKDYARAFIRTVLIKARDKDRNVLVPNKKFRGVDTILVSGHCPKGGVDIWVEEIADEFGIRKEIYSAEVNQWKDSEQKCNICHGTGIKDLGWNDQFEEWEHRTEPCDNYDCVNGWQKIRGYRSRNIKIAKACDVLYCIVPKIVKNFMDCKTREGFCIHCDKYGHPTNGGCWTMWYSREKLGKETHLVVIE